MESKLITMAREMEKVRAELANAEKRALAASVGNPGIGFHVLGMVSFPFRLSMLSS